MRSGIVPHLRVARPSSNLAVARRFYADGLGLEVLAAFADHDGFDGVVLGHADWPYHLELTRRRTHPLDPAPSDEDLLVLYLPQPADWRATVERLIAAGGRAVRSSNPYWDVQGITIEDPDGYRLVIQNARWEPDAGPAGVVLPDDAAGRHAIVAARSRDLPLLATIELAAATLLTGHAPPAMLAETTPLAELRRAQRAGRLWVALAGDTPIGFAHVKRLEPRHAHLAEIDVHPDHGRQGIGRRLVESVCDWATRRGDRGVTLTTFRDVPWNMPFYASMGFDVVPRRSLRRPLAAVVRAESRRGLDPRRRVVMERRLG